MDDLPRDDAGDAGHAYALLIAQVEALAEKLPDVPDAALLRRLVPLYYDTTSLETLRQRPPERLAQIAAKHLELASQRHPGEVRVQVSVCEDGRLAVLGTCSDDMENLFDTATLAVRSAGLSVDWATHPVLRVSRNGEGRLLDIAPIADPGRGAPESWIHLEITPAPEAVELEAIAQRVRDAFSDLAQADRERPEMIERVRALSAQLRSAASGERADDLNEAAELLDWMLDGHFTLLGYFETESQVDANGRTRLIDKSGGALGLARPGYRFNDQDALIAPREELEKYADSLRQVIVTNANQRSVIEGDEFVDVVSVKVPGPNGSTAGTARLIGLFASDVYVDRPRTIPLIRRKAETIVRRAHFPEGSHSARNLREILHLLPRDELFQSSEDELFRTCMGIRALRDRQLMRLFMRRDRYGRFFSFMVYLPRERYTREFRDRVAAELMRLMNGLSVDRQVEFLRGGWARIRCLVRTPAGTTTPLSAEEIEQKLIEVTRSWRDRLRQVLQRTEGADVARFASAFPLSYTESVTPLEAAADVLYLQRLSAENPVVPRLLTRQGDDGRDRVSGLKLYAWGSPLALSDVLPMLENFGLRVNRQEPTEISTREGDSLWIQEFELAQEVDSPLRGETQRRYFEDAFSHCWRGETENDGLNRLVLAAGLDGRQVACLRALAQYINQIGMPFGREFIEKQLAGQPQIAGQLVQLFEARFDPRHDDERRRNDEIALTRSLGEALDALSSLDADRVLRSFLSVVGAALRTNYFQRLPDGRPKSWISFKIDPTRVPELPRPRPMFEIWVCAPQVEGVHLRGGRVARGGLRWSDRREDFRTEVLGLMKAQMVKNAVIVPVGAKGGFVVKHPVSPADREAWMKQGIACYQTFLRGLLDITDNRVGGEIVAPADVVRHDEPDPYLVVAADKGTATFSDIANGIAGDYGFWLGDAFASGGSAGYDHKKMGITARGAWESVKRHFREIGRDIQNEPFTVVGIGDMSGDVFGNGMLLSEHIRLIGAFDHRHIFVDPNPDTASSIAERRRLFALPRSSWDDYDRSLISEGGGIWPRSAKSIPISEAMREAIGTSRETMTPAELISALLRAPVDLLWNGGIGTYVKASSEAHDQVGDRANDAIRVNGRELRAKVVGEGGNLGLTQAGRIEFALAGGHINTDAIDNAGGVHSSDREVNIKIPLNQLMADGKLDRATRDPLLASFTDDVASAVLRDNYIQPSCISLELDHTEPRHDEHLQLIKLLERDGLLDRAIEGLPDDETFAERRKQGHGLTRPEIAVLVAYAKISLLDAATASEMPDDPFFERDLLAYFPPGLVEREREALLAHGLRREIIATILSNAVVNRMGIAFAHQLADDHGVPRAQVLTAYAAVHEIFEGDRYWAAIEALDNRLPAEVQYRLMRRATGLFKHATRWMILRQLPAHESVGHLVQRYAEGARTFATLLPETLPAPYLAVWHGFVEELVAHGVPAELARSLTNTLVLGSALDIVDLAEDADMPVQAVAQLYFLIGERFDMLWLHRAILDTPVQGKWPLLARNHLRDDTYHLHRLLTARVLRHPGDSPQARLDGWLGENRRPIDFALRRIQEVRSTPVVDFHALVVYVRELRKLRAL